MCKEVRGSKAAVAVAQPRLLHSFTLTRIQFNLNHWYVCSIPPYLPHGDCLVFNIVHPPSLLALGWHAQIVVCSHLVHMRFIMVHLCDNLQMSCHQQE